MSSRQECAPQIHTLSPPSISLLEFKNAFTHPEDERVQLIAHRMPIAAVNAPCGEAVGYEMLARLRIGESELLPTAFLPHIARDPFLAAEMDLHMVNVALGHSAQFPTVQTHVNIAPETLIGPSYKKLRDLLSNQPESARHLALELLENTSFPGAYTDLLPALDELVAIGAGIYVDDVPLGNSTHGNLRKILRVITGIKIDGQTFQNGQRATQVERAINLVRHCGKDVVVEGIETEQNVGEACLMGATHLQGYFFGQPEPIPFAQTSALPHP
jgi:EAL domain-containing protein (putative c-di-GMP-specific phosphodiesterase class I)